MTETPKASMFRYFKCEGSALDLLRAYQDELELLSANHVKLHTEFQERSEAMHIHHQGNLKAMWQRLSAMVGLDPKKTWGNSEYQIEARYLKDGFGAILYLPRPDGDVLQTLMGAAAPAADNDPHDEEAPDKSRLN